MKSIEIFLADEFATLEWGRRFGQFLDRQSVIFLQGVLGAGKTTFCRGVLSAFGHTGAVKSPTYTLVEPYQFSGRQLYHFDLYRLGNPEELEYMGIRDYFSQNSICLIEWPGRGEGYLPPEDLSVELSPKDGGRLLTLYPESKYGEIVANSMLENENK